MNTLLLLPHNGCKTCAVLRLAFCRTSVVHHVRRFVRVDHVKCLVGKICLWLLREPSILYCTCATSAHINVKHSAACHTCCLQCLNIVARAKHKTVINAFGLKKIGWRQTPRIRVWCNSSFFCLYREKRMLKSQRSIPPRCSFCIEKSNVDTCTLYCSCLCWDSSAHASQWFSNGHRMLAPPATKIHRSLPYQIDCSWSTYQSSWKMLVTPLFPPVSLKDRQPAMCVYISLLSRWLS